MFHILLRVDRVPRILVDAQSVDCFGFLCLSDLACKASGFHICMAWHGTDIFARFPTLAALSPGSFFLMRSGCVSL